MTSDDGNSISLATGDLVCGYSLGLFPCGELDSDTRVDWYDPPERALIPLDGLHIPRRLARFIRRGGFEVTLDEDFESVVDACSRRPVTWINKAMKLYYAQLHGAGFAHSIEVWKGGRLAGGLIGVNVGAAFFGDSMFSRASNMSKVALVYLVEHLRLTGFELLDVQLQSDHLDRLGAVVVDRIEFHHRLVNALNLPADLHSRPLPHRIAGVHIG